MKLHLLLFILIAFICNIDCQSVNLLSPMGQTFYPNDLINVRWNYIGYPPTTLVRVSILNPNGFILDVRDSVISNSNVMFSLQSNWVTSYSSSTRFQVRLLVIPTNELRTTSFYGRKSKRVYIPGWGIALICIAAAGLIFGLLAAFLYYRRSRNQKPNQTNYSEPPTIYAISPQPPNKDPHQTNISIQNEKETNVVIQKTD